MHRPLKGKVFLIRRKYLATLALCLTVAAIFYVINHPSLVGGGARERALPIYSVQRDDSAVSLTFNITTAADTYTVHVLQTLNARDVRATFFVTGDWVRANPELAVRITENGHELMNLSDDHSLLRKLPAPEILANVLACSDIIETVTGHRPTVFRAPYGEYDDTVVALVAGLGMRTVQWSVDSGDWRGQTADAIARQVRNRAFPGAIVLLHSNLEQTALALPEIIESLLEAGYILVPVSELVHETQFTISFTGRQMPL
ncbi:MAG: polysaccharide deacetylase family protein [Oscillospiraceae bacterium]|nr:polysaccharide deacetylase family protein [Oscillospiraceae bacterium]